MAFSVKLVEPTKLDKITLRQAAILFTMAKRTPKSRADQSIERLVKGTSCI
jgi:HD superfamily phosphohydrolase YqeK